MAGTNYRVDLDLNLNQLLQARIENVNALPSTNLASMAGRLVYLTTDGKAYKCNGEKWLALVEGTEAKVVLSKDSTGLVYTLTQGGTELGTINIPKDMVVESGSVVKGTFNQDGSFTESETGKDTALKLVIANSQQAVYINVKDLAVVYTGGTTTDITVAVSSAGVITATLSSTVKTQLSQIANKVDKVSGKQLSTNDFTNAYKTKLDSLKAPVYFVSSALVGDSGTLDLSSSNVDASKPVIMQCTKDGEEIIISLTYKAANKAIEWAANSKFVASDNVIITAIQY